MSNLMMSILIISLRQLSTRSRLFAQAFAPPIPFISQGNIAPVIALKTRRWATKTILGAKGNKNQQEKQQPKKGKKKKKPSNAYAPTIMLPETDFSQRANAPIREPQIQDFWNKQIDLYQTLSSSRSSSERFCLHDGPPYANGDLHIGHALNKILKDFINRKQLLDGKQVHYVPGWDCHGLPIELKVLQSLKQSERKDLTPIDLRKKAATFAQKTVQKQRESFERYGIFGNFDEPYLTLQPSFEAAQIQVFGKMWEQGYIFRGRKPVHWSPSSRTALAEAELEYPPGHVSKSIYVKFPLEHASPVLQPHHLPDQQQPLHVAVWTTTPWTMPANRAVAVNPALEYSVVEHASTGRIVVATDLIESLEKTLLPTSEDETEGPRFSRLATVTGADLSGSTYRHPLYADRTAPVLEGGDYITTESGTGLVHTAPGHGQEDYQTGLKYGLELSSPVDNVGKFTTETELESLVGLPVLKEGNMAVVDLLQNASALLKLEDYSHKYPYDWRTKKPTIFRATDQWFASVEGFREAALEAVESVKWVPDVGMNRIKAFISGRGDWCISRQRSWGVPIPVFYDKETGQEVLLDQHTLDHIQAIFSEHGSDAWWTMDEKELLPDVYKDQADKWVKGTDTMDVWFDSGSSWNGVAKNREDLKYPADVYLEGSDQHRGWFQSSLLTSVAANNVAPYKTVLTHGFVLDEKGFKMSKSLGNVIDPLEIIEGGNNKKANPAYGADVLRLWVASVDYSGDVSIGQNIIKQTFESYRKLRNTARYLIGNLADFNPEGQADSNAIPYDELPSLDKWLLGRLSAVMKEVNEAMNEYQFNRATQELLRFATADLSNFYFDVAKDRLYISPIDSFSRRSCQTVLHAVLECFVKAVAPILPHMAEDIWQNLPYEKESTSVFESTRPAQLLEFAPHDEERWNFILKVRDDVNKVLEAARTDKIVGASLDAAAYVYTSDETLREILTSMEGDSNLIYPPKKTNGVDELRTTLMLSQVHIVDSKEAVMEACDEKYVLSSQADSQSGCVVGVKKADGKKCARCWFYAQELGETLSLEHGDVCQRCNEAIEKWENVKGHKFVREVEEVQPVEHGSGKQQEQQKSNN